MADVASATIAYCPEHGLHGERRECFTCGGQVEQVEMVPRATLERLVAEHAAELQRVSEEYALQRVRLIDSLTTCRCPTGWGHVVAEDCPRCNPRPRHTVSGIR